MNSFSSSDYFEKNFKNTFIDKCSNSKLGYQEVGDNLTVANKLILYIYRYSVLKKE